MRTFSFGRVRALIFFGVVIATLLVGLIQECASSDKESTENEAATHSRDDHR